MSADCVVVGASFAGLACATALARRGHAVVVLERKADPGDKLHTTGILVKDAVDQVPLLDAMPAALVRRVPGVRLYAPDLSHVDLAAPGYYFLATDTPALMRWLAAQATGAGARLHTGALFREASRTTHGFDVEGHGPCRYLVGADGPSSRVAKVLGLGQNRQFLFGIEHEYTGVDLAAPDHLHCFIDRRLAPGYIGWMVAGVGVAQVGLAGRLGAADAGGARRVRGALPPQAAMLAFLEKIAPVADFRSRTPHAVRAGQIPCGGVVRPVAAPRALLLGDAAGMVSPLTAGGIHTALRHGAAAGHAIGDFLSGRAEDPCRGFVASYPTFRGKRALRWVFDHFQADWAFNLLLGSRAMRSAASLVYFHRKGVFEPGRGGAD
ncbi:MAG: NAD(P)/FAD-dependent oxidoreductase [Rubrivivax sp.]|nr:NAD(P)/FAD-dependent oxidoreductase [Rubrivivax sp.]